MQEKVLVALIAPFLLIGLFKASTLYASALIWFWKLLQL